MTEDVAAHYAGSGSLAERILGSLQRDGRDIDRLTTADLAPVDEFHIRGRKATLELAGGMKLGPASRVLDIGSGLGGPARTLAEEYGCHVTGIDLTQAFCDAAQTFSERLGLDEKTAFRQGDATEMPFADDAFDAAMTFHVAMNIAAKDRLYREARRVVKPGGILAVYDVLQGEGGEALFPVPWAREPAMSHLATTDEMTGLLADAGFAILDVQDSTEESVGWFEAVAARMAEPGVTAVSSQVLFGEDFAAMVANQVRNLTERRIRTVSFICRA